MICELEHKIFTIEDTGFEALALDIFQFQYDQNPVYRQFVDLLNKRQRPPVDMKSVPFLPIDFYKTHRVITNPPDHQTVFESSGTTQTTPSRHFVKDESLYKRSFIKGFQSNYGPVRDWCILGLLPGYLERKDSSLVYMVNELIVRSGHPHSGFYLYEYDRLARVLQELEHKKQKTILIGVTFALIDFAEKYPMSLQHTLVMETGGMKGRKAELTRREVHDILETAWNLPGVHSEYGMTELLSQGYSRHAGIFKSPPWMKVLVREEDDPFNIKETGRGLVNVIDLANIYSCSFIATDDLGFLHKNGSFEILGRRDNSDLRGCSLMAATV